MELVIDRGRGYSSAEQNKGKDDPISTIAIDSIFSPVEKANFIVSDTRVGQVTDFDKLELEVRTDGSISANDAVAVAARIMYSCTIIQFYIYMVNLYPANIEKGCT